MSACTLEISNLQNQTLQYSQTRLSDLPVIGGLTPFTTIDYPQHLSAVLFLQGCPWRCGYCHNQHLLGGSNFDRLDSEIVIDFLKRRQSRLDAIVISGGEPLYHRNLPHLIKLIRDHGFKVGLHTSGAYPERLDQIVDEIDWVGFDFKALFYEYERITKIPGSGQKAFESAQILTRSGLDYEFRTTVTPDYHTDERLFLGAQQISRMGVKNYSLQLQRDKNNKTQGAITQNLVSQMRPLFETLTIR